MDEQTTSIMLEHARKFPKMDVTDAIKILYQNEFGCGHFVSDEKASLDALKREWAEDRAGSLDKDFVEDIGNGYCRLNLCQALFDKLGIDTVNRLFVLSSRRAKGVLSSFLSKLDILKELTKNGAFSFSPETLSCYLNESKAAGYPPVSHSEAYRAIYHPRYRVVLRDVLHYASLFDELYRLENKKTIIAIDGMCGSGKSGLASLIGELFGCAVIRMDDFFLPFQLRTPERNSEAGGYIEYERFNAEIISHLGSGEICYNKFDCSTGTFSSASVSGNKPFTVIEGTYALHPRFGRYYDIPVFLSLSEKAQKERILARDGEVVLKRFISEWIPKEKYYFSETHTTAKAAYVFDTSDFWGDESQMTDIQTV